MPDTNPNLTPQDNPDAALLAELTARAKALTPDDTAGAEALLRSVARAGLSAIADEAVMRAMRGSTSASLSALRTALRRMGGQDDMHSPPADTEAAPPPFPVYEPLTPFSDDVMSLDVLMGEGVAFVHSRVACPDEAAVVAVLWAIGTWGVRPGFLPGDTDAPLPGPDTYPRLRLKSGGPGSGKTTMLQTVAAIAARPISCDGITASALMRTVERYQPTLFLDEADAWMVRNEELRGIVNSGHSRPGMLMVSRKVANATGEDWEPAAFRTFTPIAISGIGGLAPTIEDRSITITMKKAPGRLPDRMRAKEVAAFRDRIGPHLATHADAIAAAMDRGLPDGALPPYLSGRAADNWEPLIILGRLAGGEWPERAAAALAAFTGTGTGAATHELSRNERLLADLREYHRSAIRDRWEDRRATRNGDPRDPFGGEAKAPGWMVSTSGFQKWLEVSGVESPWAAADRGKPASAEAIARALKAFGVRPARHTERKGRATPTIRGYRVADLSPLWRAHLSRSVAGETT